MLPSVFRLHCSLATDKFPFTRSFIKFEYSSLPISSSQKIIIINSFSKYIEYITGGVKVNF